MNFLNYLSDKHLNISLSITSFVLVIVFLIISKIYKNRYFLIFVISYMLYSLAFFIIYFRAYIPNFFTIILGNVLLVSSDILFMVGLSVFWGLKIKLKPFYILMTIFTLIHIFYTYIEVSVGIRIINYSGIMIIVFIFFLYRLFKTYGFKMQGTMVIIALSYIILLPYHVIRLINAAMVEEISILFRGANILKGYLLLSIIFVIIRAAAIMTYHTKKLIED